MSGPTLVGGEKDVTPKGAALRCNDAYESGSRWQSDAMSIVVSLLILVAPVIPGLIVVAMLIAIVIYRNNRFWWGVFAVIASIAGAIYGYGYYAMLSAS